MPRFPVRPASPLPLAAALLVAGMLPAPAAVRVELPGPERVLDPEEPYFLRPLVTGAGNRTECHWAVTEDGRPVGPAQGVRLELHGERGAILSAAGGRWTRTFRVRATSQVDLDAYHWVDVRVGPDPAVPAGSRGESKASGRSTDQPDGPTPSFWYTRFSREDWRDLTAVAWDPAAAGPAILALEDDDDVCTRVLAIGLDGTETCLALQVPTGPALGPRCRSLAVMADGSILVADPKHHRIARITRAEGKATLETFAGTGKAPYNGDGHRLETNLDDPASLVATPGGEVVFGDLEHGRIRRITRAGQVETLAGGGDGDDWTLWNALDRPRPATAAALAAPLGLALAPDGRILFHQGARGWRGVAALHRDGTLAPVAEAPDGIHALGVTQGNEVVYLTRRFALHRVDAQGRPALLVPGYLWDDGPMDRPMAAGAAAGLAGLGCLATAPGGGLLALDTRCARILYLGPLGRDQYLVERVNGALAERVAGRRQAAEAIRQGLLRRAGEDRQNPLWRLGAWSYARTPLGHPDAGRPPAALQGHILGFLGDPGGLAFRAQVAADALGMFWESGGAVGGHLKPAGAGAGPERKGKD